MCVCVSVNCGERWAGDVEVRIEKQNFIDKKKFT